MARAAGGGASAPASSYASLERSLDRTIASLVSGQQTREARALLIEARRLRSVIANWRSIPPAGDVHDEMLDRVLALSSAVGAAFPDSIDPPQEPETPYDEETTESYALDFEPRLYSLDHAAHSSTTIPPAPRVSTPTPAPRATALPPFRDEEPIAAPAPWPVDEPPHAPAVVATRASVPPPAQIVARASVPAPAPAPPVVDDGGHAPRDAVLRPEAAVALGPGRPAVLRGAAVPAPPHVGGQVGGPSAAPRPPDEAPASPQIITYEFDAEGDDLSVPRTQITAHAVKLSDPVDPLLVVLTDPYSPRTDAYRTLRRKLAATPGARALAVTSAQAGEGKTVFALNLALTLRESARSRVLVIEANLRTPIMARMLGFTTPECFLAQLTRHAGDPRAPWVVAEPLPKLHVMAIDPDVPHEPMLDGVTFSMGMERLKQAGYDYIIVDSPPVLGSTDCNVISDAVDALILTALPMKSMRRKMRKAVEQLEPAPILGVVVLEV